MSDHSNVRSGRNRRPVQRSALALLAVGILGQQGAGAQADGGLRIFLPENATYRYVNATAATTIDVVPPAWYLPGFDDSSWFVGQGPFSYSFASNLPNASGPGTPNDPGYPSSTAWETERDPYLRTTFVLDRPRALTVWLAVDNGVFGIYLNGVQATAVVNAEGFAYRWEHVFDVPAQYTVAGTNSLALQLEDHGGGTGFALVVTEDDPASNPVFTTNPPPTLPDLTTSEVRLDPGQFPAAVRLSARVENSGFQRTQTGSGVRVAFYRGDPASGGSLIGTAVTAADIDPGEVEYASLVWVSPTAGLQRIVAVADDDGTGQGAIAESDELNNKAGSSLLVGAGPAVLVDDLIARFKDASVDLKWTTVPGAVAYNVYRRSGSGAAVRVKQGLATSLGTYSDSGLTNATTYYYGVRWVGAQGVESTDGTEASATPTSRLVRGDTPPTIVSAPTTRGVVGQPYLYQVRASDPDAGDVLTFSAPRSPSGLTVDPATGVVRWTPGEAQAGYSDVTVQTTDRRGRFASQTFRLYISQPVVNRPPSITSVPVTVAGTRQPYEYAVTATDPDAGDLLTFTVLSGPPGLTIGALTGVVRWTPSIAQRGAFPLTVRATDLLGAFATQVFTVTVTLVNTPPTITSLPTLAAQVGHPYHYAATAFDSDPGDTSHFSLAQAPAGMVVNAETGAIDWIPQAGQGGAQAVRLVVADNAGATAQQEFVVQVAANRPPTITSPPVLVAQVGRHYHYAAVAVDSDSGETLRFSLAQAPPGMAVNAETGVIDWIPQAGQVGSQAVRLVVADVANATAQQDFVVEVTANRPPTIVSVPTLESEVGSPYRYDVDATDPDQGDILHYELLTAPGGMFIDRGTGVIAWTPTAEQTGTQAVTALASDEAGLNAVQTFAVQVSPPDTTAPTVDLESPVAGALLKTDTEIIGTVQDRHLQRWTLEYQVPGDTAWTPLSTGTQSIVSGVLGTLPVTLLANNPYRLRLVAYDAHQSNVAETEILADSNALKLGDFTLTYEDLRLPGLTFPIVLSRTYDTKRLQSADFGPGWQLNVTSVDIRRAQNYDVFITLPTGRRIRFAFSPVPLGGLLNLYQNRYVSQAGPTDYLENTDCPQLLGAGSAYLCGAFQLYDPQHYILRTKDGLTYTLSSSAGITLIEDRSGNTVSIAPTGLTTSWGLTVPISRDTRGRIIRIGEPSGTKGLSYSYDPVGNLSTVTDQSDHETSFAYDDNRFPHYLTRVLDPLGRPFVRTVFDSQGRLIAQCDANANPATLEGCVTFDSNVVSRVETLVDGRGFKTDLILDERGNVITERRWTDATTFEDTTRTFDASNNLLTETDPAGGTKTFTYDLRSNRLTDAGPDGRTTTFTYNSCDKVATETDPGGHATLYEYDSRCQLTSATDSLGAVTLYEYNSRGQRTTVSDAVGSRWQWTYDAAGLITGRVDPFGQTTVLHSNPFGDVLTRVDRNGRRTEYEYDESHRLIVETWDSGRVVEYSYDAAGRLVAVRDSETEVALMYNDRGQVERVAYSATPVSPSVTLTYTYDANGNRTSLDDSFGGRTSYVYDAVNRVVRVTQSGIGVNDKRADVTYYRSGVVAGVRRYADLSGAKGVFDSTFEYECASCGNRLTTLRHTRASDGARLMDVALSRDREGNIRGMTDADGSHSYAYESGDRLARARHGNPSVQPDEQYEYDMAGNRVASHLSAQYVYSYQGMSRAGSRLERDACCSYEYDKEGNVSRRVDFVQGTVTTIGYDQVNRVTEVTAETTSGVRLTTTRYGYNAIGQRYWVEEAGARRWEVWDGDDLLLTGSAGGGETTRMFVVGASRLASQVGSETRWRVADHREIARASANDKGEVDSEVTVDSYGRVVRGTERASDGVLGRTWDSATGWVSDGARWYDRAVGRFVSEDLLLPFGYVYAANDPVNRSDRSGLAPMEELPLAWRAQESLSLIGRSFALRLTTVGGQLAVAMEASKTAVATVAVSGGLGIALWDYWTCQDTPRKCATSLVFEVTEAAVIAKNPLASVFLLVLQRAVLWGMSR